MVPINPSEVDRVEKELKDLLLRENKSFEAPVRWIGDIDKTFERISEAMEELEKHPEGAERLSFFSNTVQYLLSIRQVKFFVSGANYQSTIDKLYFETVKSSTWELLHVVRKNNFRLEVVNEEVKEKKEALITATIISSAKGGSIGDNAEAAPSTPHDDISNLVVVRVIKEGLGDFEKPLHVYIPDSGLKDGVMEYSLRTGDLLTVEAARAKTLVERGIAVITGINMEAI